MKKIVLTVIILAVAVVGLLSLINRTSDDPVFTDGEDVSELAVLFGEQLQTLGVQRVGQPIEGFSAFILFQAFPGLTQEDFDGVETPEGHYEIVSGVAEFVRGNNQLITSAEDVLSNKGYSTLLSNVSARLGIAAESEAAVLEIVERLQESGGSLVTRCELSQRDVEACIEIYQPVCAEVNVQCVTSPCPPVKETFSNSCFACMNPLVSSYIAGECVGN